MAERNMSKPRPPREQRHPPQRPQPRAAVAAPGPSLQSVVDRLEASVLNLKRDRDTLTAELAAAKAQIAALDVARVDAVNRIDWVIESLQTALEDKP